MKKSIFIGGIFLFFFISILIFSTYYLTKEKEEKNQTVDEELYKYHVIKVNSEKKTTTTFKSKKKLIKNNEFISFQQDKEGSRNHILISNFGSQRYECTGSCFCEEEEEKRRNVILSQSLSKHLKYLLVAFSTVSALNLAKQHFKKECEKTICSSTSTTESSSLIAVIRDIDCPPIDDSELEGKTWEDFEEEDYSKVEIDEMIWEKEDEPIRYYRCQGNCIGSTYYRGLMYNSNYDRDEIKEITLKHVSKTKNLKISQLLQLQQQKNEQQELLFRCEDAFYSSVYIYDDWYKLMEDPEASFFAELDVVCGKITATKEYARTFNKCGGFWNDHNNPTVRCEKIKKDYYEQELRTDYF